MTAISLVHGDITRQDADAIVNAANPQLRGGGGVDGAIHAAAGATVLEECRTLGGCETGDAKATGPGRLPIRHIIHAVGPVWAGGGQGEDAALARCHSRALDIAIAAGCRRVAFPAISCGVYGFPLDRAASLALSVARAAHESPLEEIRFVLFEAEALTAYEAAAAR